MELVHWFIDAVLHLDRHLVDLVGQYGLWIYAILFAIVFAETGFVVTPILPGDSLLFAAGALAAVDSTATLDATVLWVGLSIAAVAGNSVNYAIGRAIGDRAFSGNHRWIKVDYLRRTERWFQTHGALTIVLSRFAPIIRTFAPFVAGIGHMPYARFQAYNVAGGVAWVALFIWGGYLFGNLPVVKQNFGLVTIGIVLVSMLPMLVVFLRERFGAKAA